jgi:hypothetical protein
MNNDEFSKVLSKLSATLGDSEDNSLWGVYYGQYHTLIWRVLEMCEDEKSYLYFEDVFLPICFLISHYLELWSKTIMKNFGVGNLKEQPAIQQKGGHSLADLIEDLERSITTCNPEIYEKIKSIKECCTKLECLVDDKKDMSQAFRFPVRKDGNKNTLSKKVAKELEWQSLWGEKDINLEKYFDIFQTILCDSYYVYDYLYVEKIH